MKMMYIDPGTGSMLISAFIALISVGFFMAKGFIYQKLNIGGDKGASKGAQLDLTKSYGLVFYSEGKQYWNVFKPVLEELNKRSIQATYFTSDEDDPGLKAEFEHIDSQYIGTGRESFYVLNRLIADMVVMTTPGLDVLEIKRSKDVKHYSHITHAPGCIAGYKAYSVDYFDSVLLGGDGDLDIIPLLEEKRNLPEKELEVIGHTYLDEYRKKLTDEKYQQSFFTEKRPVVLISPTWSNHGLLTKYGKQILSSLEKTDKYNVIVRPHPQSFISEVEMVEELMAAFPANEHRKWDREIDGLISMSQADIMISDFSGIIFDFVSLFNKPILTINSHYEKRGRDASDLEEDPWDLQIVGILGQTIDKEDVPHLPEIIENALENTHDITQRIKSVRHLFDSRPGESAVRGADYISQKMEEIRSATLEEEKTTGSTQEKISNNLTYQEKETGGIAGAMKGILASLTTSSSLLQIFLTSLLLNGYILFGKQFLPAEGLNQEFLAKITPYAISFSLILFGLFLVFVWMKDKGTLRFRKEAEGIELKDFLLLALPMAPIIQYIIANQDILSIAESLKVFVFFFVAAGLIVLVIPTLLSPVIAKNLTLALTLGSVFIIFNMASFGRVIWLSRIAMILAALIIVVFLLLFYKQKNILIIASLVFFVTNIGTSLFTGDESAAVEDQSTIEGLESKVGPALDNQTPVHTPDVFLLVYESYSNQETMNSYGYDNSEQMQFLIDNGFAIYDGTYTLAPSSLESISRVLEPAYVNSDYTEMREIIAAEAGVLKAFNNLDYVTLGAVSNDYMTKGFEPRYDYFFPDARYSIDPHIIIRDAILEGEFRFDADFSTVDYTDYVDYKQNVLAKNLAKPEFFYTHNNYPGHSQNSGVLRPNETELHLEGIEIANKEMREDIAALQLENRDAIIIVAGDHGAYLTKNGIGLGDYDISEIDRLDIQDRFGSFLAIHWPDSSYQDKYDIQVLQDVFPAVFSYLYEDDTLFDKIRTTRETFKPRTIGGVTVKDGIVVGGVNDGEPLFENVGIRSKQLNESE